MKMPPKKKGFHRHHIIPKHMGGTDDPSNIEYLTPEEHALAHLKLWEEHGLAEDAMAFNSLADNWTNGRTITGYKQSPEHIKKRIGSIDYESVSKKLKGRTSPTKGMKFAYKPNPKLGDAMRGKPKSEEVKAKISKTLMGHIPYNKLEFYCIHCRKRVPPSKLVVHGLGRAACKPKLVDGL